jgi:membrane protein YqaA with SNARE-associated domain
VFKKLYNAVLRLATHKLAIYYLAILSFFESFILPYPPPDVMLAPMVLKKPNKAWSFALITTIFSIIGGIVGYFLGFYGFETLTPYLEKMHYLEKVAHIKEWFIDYGLWIVFIAGFSPLPYKLFTIVAGALNMSLLPFIIISFFSRGLRFFLVASMVKYFGKKADIWLNRNINRLAWGLVFVIVIIGVFINVY